MISCTLLTEVEVGCELPALVVSPQHQKTLWVVDLQTQDENQDFD